MQISHFSPWDKVTMNGKEKKDMEKKTYFRDKRENRKLSIQVDIENCTRYLVHNFCWKIYL